MTEWFVKNPEIAVWALFGSTSLLTAASGAILSFLKSIYDKMKSQEGQLDEFRKEIIEVNRSVAKNLSEICSAQISVGRELDNIRRTLVGTTVVLQRRKAEVTQIREDARRTQDQMGEIRDRLQKSLQTIQKHDRILTRMI